MEIESQLTDNQEKDLERFSIDIFNRTKKDLSKDLDDKNSSLNVEINNYKTREKEIRNSISLFVAGIKIDDQTTTVHDEVGDEVKFLL